MSMTPRLGSTQASRGLITKVSWRQKLKVLEALSAAKARAR
jgi:hypothetical protein